MQEALKRYTEDTRRAYGVEMQIRVGLISAARKLCGAGTT
jgi:hypothetical protein